MSTLNDSKSVTLNGHDYFLLDLAQIPKINDLTKNNKELISTSSTSTSTSSAANKKGANKKTERRKRKKTTKMQIFEQQQWRKQLRTILPRLNETLNSKPQQQPLLTPTIRLDAKKRTRHWVGKGRKPKISKPLEEKQAKKLVPIKPRLPDGATLVDVEPSSECTVVIKEPIKREEAMLENGIMSQLKTRPILPKTVDILPIPIERHNPIVECPPSSSSNKKIALPKVNKVALTKLATISCDRIALDRLFNNNNTQIVQHQKNKKKVLPENSKTGAVGESGIVDEIVSQLGGCQQIVYQYLNLPIDETTTTDTTLQQVHIRPKTSQPDHHLVGLNVSKLVKTCSNSSGLVQCNQDSFKHVQDLSELAPTCSYSINPVQTGQNASKPAQSSSQPVQRVQQDLSSYHVEDSFDDVEDSFEHVQTTTNKGFTNVADFWRKRFSLKNEEKRRKLEEKLAREALDKFELVPGQQRRRQQRKSKPSVQRLVDPQDYGEDNRRVKAYEAARKGLSDARRRYLDGEYFDISTIREQKRKNLNKMLEKNSFKCNSGIRVTVAPEKEFGCCRARPYVGMRKERNWFYFYMHDARENTPKIRRKSILFDLNTNRECKTKFASGLKLPAQIQYRKMLTDPPKLTVKRSMIHRVGVFAEDFIADGSLLIEYVGEIIRNVLVEHRERKYRERGFGSYMFRLDRKFTIDATLKGSIARFINHSCEPNCVAKIITHNEQKHIVLVASKNIIKGEEICYDYKMPTEDEKVPCMCNSSNCRRFLN